jgi:hypothetical protein
MCLSKEEGRLRKGQTRKKVKNRTFSFEVKAFRKNELNARNKKKLESSRRKVDIINNTCVRNTVFSISGKFTYTTAASVAILIIKPPTFLFCFIMVFYFFFIFFYSFAFRSKACLIPLFPLYFNNIFLSILFSKSHLTTIAIFNTSEQSSAFSHEYGSWASEPKVRYLKTDLKNVQCNIFGALYRQTRNTLTLLTSEKIFFPH